MENKRFVFGMDQVTAALVALHPSSSIPNRLVHLRSWSWSLQLMFVIWSLKLRVGVWNWGLNLKSRQEFKVWCWIECWVLGWSLKLKFEGTDVCKLLPTAQFILTFLVCFSRVNCWHLWSGDYPLYGTIPCIYFIAPFCFIDNFTIDYEGWRLWIVQWQGPAG